MRTGRKSKVRPYSITERRVPELIPVLGSQPAGDMSHKPGGRLSLFSDRPARGITEKCRINANRGPWQLFARAPLLTRDKDLSQPATRVDTTCRQLFRSAINTAHFLIFFVAEVMSNYLTTDGLKKISLLPEAP